MVNDEIEDGESRVDVEIGTISEAAAEENKAYSGSVSLENETAFDGSQCAEVPNGQENLAQQPIIDEHCHSSIKVDKNRNRRPLIKLTIALCLCVAFMIGEIVGGILANSISIQTDAAHMATDIVGFIFSILAILISKKKPSRRMTFGYFRSEVMGAFLSILVIWVLTAVLVYLAVMRVVTMSFEIEPVPMVATASCGVAFNIIMFIVLDTNLCFRDKKEPTNDEEQVENGQTEVTEQNEEVSAESVSIGRRSKAITRIRNIFKRSDKSKKAKKEKDENINLRAAAIHVIGDLIQSVGVLVAAVIIYINPEYKLADPICTFTFSALVLSTTSFIVKDIFLVLMESAPSPKQLKYTDVVNALTTMIGVKDIHNLNIWCLTMDKIALNVHLVIDRDGDTQKVLKEASDILRSQFKIELSNIQVEYFSDGMTSCEYCKLPEK